MTSPPHFLGDLKVGFITSLAVQAKVKVIAEQLDFTLTAEQTAIVDARTDDAYQEILFKLSNQGYDKAQIDTWQAGGRYQSDIATYLSLLDFLSASINVDETLLEKYNVSEMLDVENIVLLDTSGEIIDPAVPKGGSKGLYMSEVF